MGGHRPSACRGTTAQEHSGQPNGCIVKSRLQKKPAWEKCRFLPVSGKEMPPFFVQGQVLPKAVQGPGMFKKEGRPSGGEELTLFI